MTDLTEYERQSQVIGYQGNGIWINKKTMHYHYQDTPAKVWTIKHNLGKMPNVKILTSDGQLCLADIYYVDENTVRIELGGSESGKAYLD